MVVQLAKLDGLKVIASAGSDAKVEFLREIGADVAFNYKTTDTQQVLEREGPLDMSVGPSLTAVNADLSDSYWDNVGGSTLDAALGCTKDFARIIACGMITGYNDGFKGQNFKVRLPCMTIDHSEMFIFLESMAYVRSKSVLQRFPRVQLATSMDSRVQ